MARLNPPALHAVERTAGSDRRAVVRLPEARICVHVVGLDALRAAGLQAIFENNTGIDILVEEVACLSSVENESDASVHMIVVGAHAGPDLFQVIATLRSDHPELPIVVMSHASGEEAILRVLMLGAKGFLHEASTPGQFEKAVRMIASGSIWAPRRVQAELIERLLTALDTQHPNVVAGVGFTGREKQVLELLLDGNSNREIARSLKIEERTVKTYVTRLMQKMGVKNRTALTMRAQDRSTAIVSAASTALPAELRPSHAVKSHRK